MSICVDTVLQIIWNKTKKEIKSLLILPEHSTVGFLPVFFLCTEGGTR